MRSVYLPIQGVLDEVCVLTMPENTGTWDLGTYQAREYWYIGSMLARSAIEKKRMVEWTAMGV